METTIRPDAKVTTLINVFTVEPENRSKLVEMLKDGTETLISKVNGWISTNFLESKDGRRIISYSQWRSPKDIEAMRQAPGMGAYIQRVLAIAKHESIECDVSYAHHV